MKRRTKLFSIIMLCTVVFFSGCGKKDSRDNSLNEIKEKGKFVVGLDDSFPPMGFKDENGEIVGFDIDLAKEAAKRMGVKVEFKAVDWDGVIFSLKNKDIDVIWNGLTVTDERKKQINFSKTYLKNRQIVVVKEGSSIEKKEDLKGKIVGVQMGSSSETALNNAKELVDKLKEVRKFSNNTEALLDLKNGGVDAVIVDEIVGRYYTSKKPGQYTILDEDLGKEDYAVGFRKEDVSFLKELDKTLDAMKKDGSAGEISKKWFGKDIVAK